VEVQIPTSNGAILRAKKADPGHVRQSIYSKQLSRGQNWYGVDANWGVVDGVHIGTTW